MVYAATVSRLVIIKGTLNLLVFTMFFAFPYVDVLIQVPKEQHKYILGRGGQTLQDMFEKTGVWIEVSYFARILG